MSPKLTRVDPDLSHTSSTLPFFLNLLPVTPNESGSRGRAHTDQPACVGTRGRASDGTSGVSRRTLKEARLKTGALQGKLVHTGDVEGDILKV